MRRRQIKKEIFSILRDFPLDKIYTKIQTYPEVAVVNSLFMALCDHHEVIRWHAVSCFGEVVSLIAAKDIERARVIMRRFLWSLNDESGGIGWGAPESMAEVMVRNDQLRAEYLHMLISYMQEDGDELYQDGNFLELPLLQKGLLWGVGCLTHAFPGEMLGSGVDRELVKYTESASGEIRNLSLWALSGFGSKCTTTDKLLKGFDGGTLRIYLHGEFQEVGMDGVLRKLGIS